ncbi:hypothetical protein A3752_22900, partial [Oleiphilus sp. HI0081]
MSAKTKASPELKYISEFRQGSLAKKLCQNIANEVQSDKRYRLMEFCGGHTHTIFRYGIPDLLPENIDLLHGPGCPVCVLPISAIDNAISLALQPNTILCSYGDMLRVPGSKTMSLLKARAQGADVRMLYSPLEALTLAQDNPGKDIVFFAVGFETTTPPTVAMLDAAVKANIKNLFIYCNHVLTPPAITGILEPAKQAGTRVLDGLIGPGHVSVITGERPYLELAKHYQTAITISGFEPLDILQSILMLVRQINRNTCQVENQYTRAVSFEGNQKAQALTKKYLDLRQSFEWRGLGEMPDSALKLREEYQQFDAEYIYKDTFAKNGNDIASDNKACECPAVLTGQKKPYECKLFNKPCTPENPLGSCMVSSEGACAAY